MKLIKTTTKLLLFISLLTSCLSCQGQPTSENPAGQPGKDPIGKNVSQLDQAILIIYQDQASNYWFGSNGSGVYRYDGKAIIQYTTEDGLVSNQIRGIQGDKAGNVYFDTPAGVSKFNGKTFTILEPRYSYVNEWKLEADDLWFKGNDQINAVFRYDGQSLIQLTLPEYDLEKAFGREFMETPFSPYGVYSIYKDNQGNVWFGTLAAGVYRYDGTSLWISENELTVLEDGRAPGVRSIIQDKDGHFWLSNILHRYRMNPRKSPDPGTDLGKYEKLAGIEPPDGQKTMNFPYFMSAVTDDKNQDLWMVRYDEGVWRYDGENLFHYPIKDGEKGVLLFSIYKDNQGTLWLGTHTAGVFKFNGKTFEKFEPGPGTY